jgi:hypothetical protein
MKVTTAEAVRLLHATEGHHNPRRTLSMDYLAGRLTDTPDNAWAVQLVTEWRAADAAPLNTKEAQS